MNIMEHELKRFDLWQDELQKKKKAYILSRSRPTDGSQLPELLSDKTNVSVLRCLSIRAEILGVAAVGP